MWPLRVAISPNYPPADASGQFLDAADRVWSERVSAFVASQATELTAFGLRSCELRPGRAPAARPDSLLRTALIDERIRGGLIVRGAAPKSPWLLSAEFALVDGGTR